MNYRKFCVFQFSTVAYERVVQPKTEASFLYVFAISESFSARPFGLTVNVNYKDSVSLYFFFILLNLYFFVFDLQKSTDILLCCHVIVLSYFFFQQEGNFFQDAVFNETVTITEPDEGLDGET